MSDVGYQRPWKSQPVVWAGLPLARCLNIRLTKEWASPAASPLACTYSGGRCAQIFDLSKNMLWRETSAVKCILRPRNKKYKPQYTSLKYTSCYWMYLVTFHHCVPVGVALNDRKDGTFLWLRLLLLTLMKHLKKHPALFIWWSNIRKTRALNMTGLSVMTEIDVLDLCILDISDRCRTWLCPCTGRLGASLPVPDINSSQHTIQQSWCMWAYLS